MCKQHSPCPAIQPTVCKQVPSLLVIVQRLTNGSFILWECFILPSAIKYSLTFVAFHQTHKPWNQLNVCFQTLRGFEFSLFLTLKTTLDQYIPPKVNIQNRLFSLGLTTLKREKGVILCVLTSHWLSAYILLHTYIF